MKKNSNLSKNKYKENLSILLREVTYYKHANFKKETRNIIKTKHFLKYFESCHNSFLYTPLEFVWCLNDLSKQFLEDISDLEYEEIIPLIIQLLCGDFKNAVKKKKLIDLNQDKQKLCSFYLLPLNKTKNKNILFALCLKGAKFVSSIIHFLSISTNLDFEEKALNFLDEINKDKNYPIVDFDKNGIYLVDVILFSHKEKDTFSDTIICYPLKKLNLEDRKVFRIVYINKEPVSEYNNPSDFMENELNISIIKQIEDNQYETLIISALEGEFWDYKLSIQEKKYIKNSETFILSGRPGTGKTTVILFKLFCIYFNYILKKSHRLIDLDYLNNNNEHNNNDNKKDKEDKKDNNKENETNNITESLRVVFTSLSQHLCEKQQSIFEQSMVRKVLDLSKNYTPLSDNILRSISSFRQLYKYPIFVNFRKIMFMIDGSLTFQFFSRNKLTTYEGDPETEYNYVKDYEYEVNKYSYNDNNYKFINFFYRAPEFLNEVVKLKEANESTFLNFYENFLSRRKKVPLAETLYLLNLNPLEIYCQLLSVIKGSYSSHLYMNNCISKEEYKKRGKKITDLPNLDEIYDVCILYEDYKKQKNYFDIQDLVNFLIRQVKLEFKNVKLINYFINNIIYIF